MSRFQRVTPRVAVSDVGRAVAFYTGKLGFAVDLLWPQEAPTFGIVERESVQVGFFVPDASRDGERLGACELVFDVEDVRGLHASLAGAVPVEWGPEVYFYGRREFAVRDPDGNLLIFSEPTDDPPTCPEE